MSAMDGGDRGEQPDLDLDRPPAGDARVMALFRDGLSPAGAPLDLGTIERRAKRKHRRHQAMASGVVTMAAALAAVAVVLSPWSADGGAQEVPAGPTPPVTSITTPKVSKASLLRTSDLQPGSGLDAGRVTERQ